MGGSHCSWQEGAGIRAASETGALHSSKLQCGGGFDKVPLLRLAVDPVDTWGSRAGKGTQRDTDSPERGLVAVGGVLRSTRLLIDRATS